MKRLYHQILEDQPEPTSYFRSDRRKSGEPVDLQIDWNYDRNDEGKVTGLISIITDITERKKAEEELKKHHDNLEDLVIERTKALENNNKELIDAMALANKMKVKAESANKAKSEFLANMSHELRTPMHGILSFARFGLNKIDIVPKEKLVHYYSQIFESGNRLMLLLNDLLDLSKLEAGRVEYQLRKQDFMSVENAIIQEFSTMIKEKKLVYEFLHSDVETTAVFDPQKITQVFRNLLSNAIKFTPNGKKITVSIKKSEIENAGDGSLSCGL